MWVNSNSVVRQIPRVVVVHGKDPYQMVLKGLEYFAKPGKEKIILKPNLINDRGPPTTTPYEVVEALIKYYIADYEVVIAEGSGWCETSDAYRVLGYYKMAEKYGVKIVDINQDDFEVRRNPEALCLKQFEFPSILKNCYLISVPVLKEHSLTTVTISLKNMLGATLGEETRATWKKGRFHGRLDESIVDINLYLKPNLAVVDGRVAGVGGELGALPEKHGVMIFSEDLVAADAMGAKILGYDPLEIAHLKLAKDRGLGEADLNNVEVLEVR